MLRWEMRRERDLIMFFFFREEKDLTRRNYVGNGIGGLLLELARERSVPGVTASAPARGAPLTVEMNKK